MGWIVSNEIYSQKAVLFSDNGLYIMDTINCCVIKRGRERYLQYPRTVVREQRKYVMYKYNSVSDTVYYKLKTS